VPGRSLDRRRRVRLDFREAGILKCPQRQVIETDVVDVLDQPEQDDPCDVQRESRCDSRRGGSNGRVDGPHGNERGEENQVDSSQPSEDPASNIDQPWRDPLGQIAKTAERARGLLIDCRRRTSLFSVGWRSIPFRHFFEGVG
jgi:hypothetical protein